MVVFLYRWRLKTDKEQQFADAWAAVTKFHLENSNSLGSRLHKGSDRIYYGYACWPDIETRKVAFDRSNEMPEFALMREAVDESFPEVELSIVEDLISARIDA